jgi:hypothetical protein
MTDWQAFLQTPATSNHCPLLRFQAVIRDHRDWLILPLQPRLAARALVLYPAQRRFARLAKNTLRTALRVGLPLPRRTVRICLSDPFPQFLMGLADMTATFPPVGILAGNPGSPGRRFTFLVFDEEGSPVAVAKAGRGAVARKLIRHEADFLESNQKIIQGLPPFLARFDSGETTAVATAYVEGFSPPPQPPAEIVEILEHWVDRERQVPLMTIELWRSLAQASIGDPLFEQLSLAAADRRVHPVIWHGDFAPWNIKIQPDGDWIVMDCERSEREGIPGWNLLHYLIQAGVLIERLGTATLLRRIRRLLESRAFAHYAEQTGIAGFEREIVLSYLLYVLRVLKPTAGAAEIERLSAAFARMVSP